MEEIYETPDVPNIISKITKQKQEITSEFIDNTKLHPDHAFEVINFLHYLNLITSTNQIILHLMNDLI